MGFTVGFAGWLGSLLHQRHLARRDTASNVHGVDGRVETHLLLCTAQLHVCYDYARKKCKAPYPALVYSTSSPRVSSAKLTTS